MRFIVLAALVVAAILISASATWFVMESQFEKGNYGNEKIKTDNLEETGSAMGAGKVVINIENPEESKE